MKKFFITIIAMLLPLMASATDITRNGINYSLNSSTETAQVISGSYSGRISIPSQVTYNGITYSVTSIGYGAFKGCSGLTSITIPNSVTSIGKQAFSLCSGLTSITIPNSVTSIGQWAFSACSGLTSITIPNSVTSISYGAFLSCGRLTSVTIPNSVTYIGCYAFEDCWGLTSITIPKSLNLIDEDAFLGCVKLNSVYISDLSAWCNINFQGGEGYTSPFRYASHLFLNGKEIIDLVIPDDITSIRNSAFFGCTCLTSVTIPNSVTSIGFNAFSGCTGLTSITIPNSVTSIGGGAFSGCSGLTSVTIGNSVTSIGSSAFSYCSGLTSIVSKIKKPFKIDPFNTDICASAKLTVPYGTKFLYESTEGWNKFQNIVEADPIDERVIYEKDFTGITEFTDWSEFDESQTDGKVGVDPNGVAITVGIQTGELWQPQVMVVPDVLDLEKGGNYRVVVTAKFPTNGSMRINMGSWSDYYQDVFPITATDDFQEIVCDFYDWPANFKDAHILFQCGDFKGTTIVKKIQVIDMGDTVIPFSVGGISYLLNLKDKIAKVTQNPQKYQGNVTIPATITYKGEVYIVTSIDKNAFQGCSDLSSVTIPNSVTRIEDYAFEGCIGLKSVIIPNNVIVIGDRAFDGCSGLTSVTIGKSVKDIGDFAFYGSGLTSVTIPNSVTSIGWYAFANCSGLTSVTIPNSVTSISWYAFENCSGLTSVTIPNSVTSIGRNAFSGCSGLKFICLASDKYPSSSLGNTTCQYIMPQSAFEAGIPQDITNYATYTVAPKYIKVKSTTATTATLELTPIDLTGGSTGATPYEVTMYDLKPGSSVKGSWELETKDRGLASIPTVTTKNLVMNVQPAKLLSKEKAGLLATVNEPDDDKHYGFEWQRNDAPSNMTPYQVQAQLYEGKIIGTLSGLDPDKYYKYRPFYKADDGTLFRGEWEAFITGDATVKFEPDVHTRESVVLPDGNIVLTLVLADGTEMTLEKGFELRIIVRQAATRSDWSAGDENITRVVISGDGTSATVEGLEPGTEYVYRAYVKTESGTIYGEEKTFKTPLPGDANDNGAVDAADIVEVVNAKAGHPSASFNLNNADANADGSFTEADITATADIIMKR